MATATLPGASRLDRGAGELELEVDHLKRLVAKLLLDKQMLQDIAKKLGRQSLIDEGILK